MCVEKKVIYKDGVYFYECPKCNFMTRKSGHTLCRKCYIGRDHYNKEIYRRRKSRRHRKRYRIKFKCEMGYRGCELRGYCNGDC